MINRRLFGAVVVLSLVTAVPFAAQADDAAAQKLLDQAIALYKDRGTAGQVEKALTLLADAEKQATSTDMKYDVLILESRCIFWQGDHQTATDQKLATYESGIAKADAAKALSADYAEAYYYHALNLGRWAETKGVMASLGHKGELLQALDDASKRSTRSLDDGQSIDGFGPARIQGRVYFKLPSIAGGSREKALQFLKQAYEGSPTTILNGVYYADTLAADKATRPQAIKILNDLISADANTLNVDRVPENKEDQELAKKLLADVSKK